MACILIVEDETFVLQFAESVLNEAGHKTVSATAHDGCCTILQAGEKPDLVFIHYKLTRGPDGIEVSKAVRQFLPMVPIIYTSAAVVDKSILSKFVDGSAFLPKPYTADDLLEAVRRQLGHI